MKLPRNARIFQGQLDVAPFAGVFFLLLMFLLLSSSLVHTPGVRIDLPETDQPSPGITDETVVVAIDSTGRIYFDRQVTSLNELLTKLRGALWQAEGPLTLIIQADRRADVEKIAQIMDTARSAGISRTFLATRQRDLIAAPPAQKNEIGPKP